jgi:hypothetical protein
LVRCQTTIGVINFDGSGSYIGYSLTGSATAVDSTNNAYGIGNVQVSGEGLEVKNGDIQLTSNAINTASFSNISLKFRLASLYSSTNGSDAGDYVTLWISLDNGSTWSAEIKVSGASNAKWSYDTALAIASHSFDGDGSVLQFQPSGGGVRTTDGYGTITLNSLPSVSNLKFRISIKNNDVDEIWAIDDILITGTSGGCSTPSGVSAASSVSRSFELDAKWTNGSCYDEVVVFMDETSGIQSSPSGTYGSYTGTATYTTAGQCVYNGVGDSIRVFGLDNGTTYYFEVFTRRDTTWSSGVQISGTPDFNGISFSALNTPLTIDFDNTLTGSNNGTFSGSGFSPNPSTGQLNSSSWSVTGFSEGECEFDSTKTTGDFARGTSSGGVGTGGMYAFQVASGDYGLGVQPVGDDFTPGEFILRLANETGSTATSVLLSYDVYLFNDQDRSNAFNLSYSPDGVNYTSISDLSLSSATTSGISKWRQNLRIVHLELLSIPDNSFFYFRWTGGDVGGSGDRDQFALDNIKISLHTSVSSSPNISASDSLESIKALNIGLTLASSIITDSIRLSNSILSIGNYDLSIVNAAFVGNDSTYIETNGSGKVIVELAGDTTFTLPIGRSNFSPITLDFSSVTLSSSSAIASVRVIDSIHSEVSASTSTTDYIERYWTVAQNGISSFTCDVTANYHDSDIVGTEGNLFMGKWDGSVWDVGSSVNVSNNKLTIFNVTSFSDFTGAGSPLLPVDWLYFRGERKGDFDVLEWATASELNNQKFVIERSYDNLYFESVNEILSKGNSTSTKSYTWAVLSQPNRRYYRLCQVGFNGQYAHSETICLISKSRIIDLSYTNESLIFKNLLNAPIYLEIIDLRGRIVMTTPLQKELTLNRDMFKAGIYLCIVKNKAGLIIDNKKMTIN